MALSSANVDFSALKERRLRAMVHADVAGYSRLIGLNDAGTVRRLRTLRRALIDPAIRAFHGRIVNTAGDSMMIIFDSVDAAVQCALHVQRQVPVLDGDQPPERRIRYRIGISIGDVITDRTDVHGDGSNIAARLQSISPVGGICVSRAVRDHVGARLGLEFEPLGRRALKNIAQPVEAFALRLDPGAPMPAPAAPLRAWKPARAGTVALLLAGGVAGAWWIYHDRLKPVAEAPRDTAPSASAVAPPDLGISRAPRLSLVVLPFDNLDGTTEQNSRVDGLTEDLTTYLAQMNHLEVTARNTALTYKGKPVDIRRVGNELGVRYAVEGSLRKVDTLLRLIVQVVSTETGAHLWAAWADTDAAAGGAGQDEFIARVSQDMWRRLVDIESIRGARDRPGDPDATDILLQAYALHDRSWNPQQQRDLIALYERAVQLDPSSAEALAGLAYTLLDNISGADDPTAPATLARAEALVAAAESLQQRTFIVLYARGYLLLWQRRLPEAIATFQSMIDGYPRLGVGYNMLGTCLLFAGRADDAISNKQVSIRLDPHNPRIFYQYTHIGQASLLLGRYDEAVAWAQRSLAAVPDASAKSRGSRYAEIAAAHALAGRIEEARAAAAKVKRLWPTMTVRGWWGFNVSSPVLAAQIARVQDGMRLAGLRDHAGEDADFGVVSDDTLHTNDEAHTPTTVTGARTIQTADLAIFLQREKPLVLDVNGWGKSIPGAIGLRGSGIGGDVSDPYQARVATKMRELTHGDRSMPVVTMARNAERFSSRNLALRLVALGYTNVIWYRGGQEAWEVAGQPETEVAAEDW